MRFIRQHDSKPIPIYYREQSDSWAFCPPDYKEAFRVEIKAIVPYDHREWDGNNKQWVISADYVTEAVELLEELFPGYVGVWLETEEEMMEFEESSGE